MDTLEKMATLGTQSISQRQTQQKHNTLCVGNHYSQTKSNNVNKTWSLLQTNVGKDEPNIINLGNDEPNIVFIWKMQRTSQHRTVFTRINTHIWRWKSRSWIGTDITMWFDFLIFWFFGVLTPFLTIFQLYHGDHF